MAKRRADWPVVGHRAVVAYLQRSLRRGTVAHAYLIVGPGNVGKTTLAAHFAATLLCPTGPRSQTACGECLACRRRLASLHPDYHTVVASEAGGKRPWITLEQIQELQKKISRRPMLADRTVALIVDAHHLSEGAANALLKTLEEPAGQTTLVLTSVNLGLLPATLRSRCQLLHLRFVPTAEIAAALAAPGRGRDVVLALARLAGGCPGRAFGWLADPSLRVSYLEGMSQLLRLVRQPPHQRLAEVAALLAAVSASLEPRALGQRLLSWAVVARDQLLRSLGCDGLTSLPQPSSPIWGDAFGWRDFLDQLTAGQAALRQQVNARLVLETLVLSLPSPDFSRC